MALLAIRFLAELGMLLCLGVGGWQRGDGVPVSVLLGIGLPVVAAAVWGRWVAPRAVRRLSDPARLTVEVVLFAGALVAVWGAQPSPAMSLVGAAVLAAFVISIPSRGHERVEPRPIGGGVA
jgi:hypothetical protein